MNKNIQKVVDYYKNPESRWGYTFLTWDTKHFGYYPSQKNDISEKKAQQLMIDLVVEKLRIQKSNLVLDAGCGRGTTACYLAQKYGFKIVGIDIVPFEINIARRKAKDLNLTNKVNFSLKDYSNTSFPDNYFDKIFTLETLVHSPNIEKTLSEFYRILKPKGELALFEYSISSPKEFNNWERQMIGLINKGSAMMSLSSMLHDKLPVFIKNTGFTIISDQDITDYMLPSLKRFYKYARIPYVVIKFLNLQKYFINTTAAIEFYNLAKKGLVKYRVFVAQKD